MDDVDDFLASLDAFTSPSLIEGVSRYAAERLTSPPPHHSFNLLMCSGAVSVHERTLQTVTTAPIVRVALTVRTLNMSAAVERGRLHRQQARGPAFIVPW